MWSSESNESLAICRAKASFFSYFKILRVDPVPQGRIWGGGCGRGCATPPHPPPKVTRGFLIQLIFCKKKKTLWLIGVEVKHETGLKNL